jgi:hypothetical protein
LEYGGWSTQYAARIVTTETKKANENIGFFGITGGEGDC